MEVNKDITKIGIVLLIVVLAYFAFKFATKKFKEWQIRRSAVDSAGKDINLSDLSFQDSEYVQMTQQLFTAMDGVGTSVPTIENIMSKLKTKSDWLRIVHKFGTRTISSGLFFVPDVTGDLYQCLESELSAADKVKINNSLANIGVNI